MPAETIDPNATPAELEAEGIYELEVGNDQDVWGRVYADDAGQFNFSGDRKDLVKEMTEFYAKMYSEHLAEFGADEADFTPHAVLAFMDARMNGRTWARVPGSVESPEEDQAGTGEPEPKPTANAYAPPRWETLDDGRLVLNGGLIGNTFCPTGEGGGVDPTCKTGDTESPMTIKEVRDHGDVWKKSLTKDEHDAVVSYTRASERMNGVFPNNVEEMDSALSRSVLPKPIVTYRGLSHDPGWEVGEVDGNPRYVSTSPRRGSAEEFADEHNRGGGGPVLEIHVPAGTHAAYIPSSMAYHAGEDEVVLPRGSKLEITHVGEEGGRTVYKARLKDYPIPQRIEEDY